MKKFTFLLFAIGILISYVVNSQITVTVGTGTATQQYCPIYSFYGYNYTQQIYTSAEITAGGASAGQQINAIRFYWAGSGNLNNAGTWSIFLANSTQSEFATTTSWLPFAQFTEVYSGAVTLPAAAGWMTINLTTPFIWDGNNIIVAVDENVPNYGTTAYWNSTSTGSVYRTIYYYSDGTNPVPASPPTATSRNYNRPNIQFDFISLTACSGTPNAGIASVSSSTGCPAANFNLSAADVSVGSGISYQWQSSSSASGPWTNIVGATSSNYSTSVTVETFFRLVTTCANSAESNMSNVVSYLPVGDACACGSYPSIWASSTGDEEITNVTVGTLNNSSTCATLAPGPGSILNRYSNYTGFVTAPLFQNGETVNFSLTQTSCGGSYGNGFQIYIDWNQDGDFLDAGEQVYSQPVAATGNHTKTGTFTVPLSAALGTTRMRVVNVEATFPNTNNYAQTTTFSWGETEDYCITVYAATPCAGTPDPGTASISATSGCSATNFTLSATNITVASSIEFQWQSAPSATGPWTDIAGADLSSYTATATSDTWYRLVTVCLNSMESNTSNVVSYSVTGDACLCGAYPSLWASSTGDEEITNVTVGTMNNSSTCSTLAPGPGSILNRYSNYSGFVAGPNVQNGELVNFSLTQTSCGGSYGNGFQIYIDWNQDGDFLDAGEQVYSQPVAATGNHTKTGTFTVPVTALPGITRMRVVNVESAFPNTNNYAQTNTFSWGETEDYCITVVPSTPCDAMPEAGNASPATQTVSMGTTANLTLNGSSVVAGLSYQWQQSDSPSGPYWDIAGATSINYTTTALATDAYFRCVVTCDAVAESDTSIVAEVLVVAAVNMMTGSVNTCGALFYDAGGASANYNVNELYTLTVYPDVPGSMVVVTFSSFTTESGFDVLSIYDGNSSAAPLLGSYSGSTVPPSFTSTAADGSLTFVFDTDGSVQYAGWVGEFTCYNPCVYITPTFDPVGPYCSGWPISDLPTTSLEGINGTWSPVINNMATTTYTFTPNAGECAYATTLTVTVNPNTPATFDPVGPFCEGSAIAPLPTTSLEGITGTWSPAIDNMQTTEYTFVADGGVCAWTTLEVEIDTVPAIIINNSLSTELNCDLQYISLTASGGTSYIWSGGIITLANTVVNTPGTYTVTVNGANGCTTTAAVVITQNIVPPTVSFINNTGSDELICTIPSISITAQGGVDYLWSGGETPNDATNTFTVSGDYYVTVTGANGCESVGVYTITQPGAPDITENVTDALCFGQEGSAEIIINSGGTPPFTIIWDDGTDSFINPNIPVGVNFGYTVTDADLCTTAGDVLVNEPAVLQVLITSSDISCYGYDDGIVDASTTTGGTSPYVFSWSNGANTQIISDLESGTYRVTVTDSNGCEDDNYVTLIEPLEILATLNVTDAVCGVSGGIIEALVSGGAGSYAYVWSNGASFNTISGLVPDNYTVTVTDANFCTASFSADVDRTGNILAAISVVSDVSCAGVPDAVLGGSSPNGAMPLSFNWSNGAATDVISNIPADTYYLTVTDAWGCVGYDEERLTLPDSIILEYYVTDLKCYGSNDGKINISLSGGDPPFNVLWSNASTQTSISALSQGQYALTVTDSRNCTLTQSFVVNQPDPINFEYSKTDVSCYGYSDGKLTMNASGGEEPYYYSVIDSEVIANTQTVNSLSAGNYMLRVSDNNGCTASGTVAIYEPAEINAKITASNPSCIGNNDGFIAVFASGGTAPYYYTFDNMDMDTSVYNRLKEGNYTVAVTDVNGCNIELGSVRLNEALFECLDVPTAFTPNGDGVNDKWEIRNIELYPGAYIHVFNRWGQEVYSGRSDSEPWDGAFNGKVLPVGAYLYVINPNNDSIEYTGTISIVY